MNPNRMARLENLAAAVRAMIAKPLSPDTLRWVLDALEALDTDDPTELTTGQVADLLNVSRPHVVKLLEEGHILFHMVGTHRRVRLADAVAYKQARGRETEAALAEMVAIGEELDLPY